MDTVSCMNVPKSEAHLDENIQDLVFLKVIVSSFFCLFLDLISKVATICVFHDDTQFAFFGSVDLIILDDVWMLENFEKFCFFDCSYSTLFTNRVDVHLLDDVMLFGVLLNDDICFSLTAGCKTLNLLVSLRLFGFHNFNSKLAGK